MKFQSTITKSFVAAGFAAALLLTASVAKGQEITNTQFSDGPNVAALAQPTAPQQAGNFALSPEDAMRASETISASADPLQASATQIPAPSTDVWLTMSLSVGVGLLALYVLASAKRTARSTARATYVAPRMA